LPPIWKAAEVVPVPKVSPPMSIQNDLLSMSLHPTLVKMSESFVGRWLPSFLEPKLDHNHFGKRKCRSPTHTITSVLHTWMSCLDSGGSVSTVFVGFRKAFDLVNHNILHDKLKKYCIPDFLFMWFGSSLSYRKQRVSANQFISSWKELSGAMPQGSWLSPLSFSASEVTTIWRYTNVYIIIIIIIFSTD